MQNEGQSGQTGEVQTPPSDRNIQFKLHQRKQLENRLQSAKNNLHNLDTFSIHYSEIKISLLDRSYEQFEELQSQLEMLDESQLDDPIRQSVEEIYAETKAKLVEHIAVLKSQSETNLNSTRLEGPQTTTGRTHLPNLQLSTFSGAPQEWTDFYSTFNVLVHQNKDLLPVEKFQYLKSSLKGNAANIIHSLEITGTNYDKAIQLLKARYDNKRYIFQAHLSKMFEVEKITRPNVSSLRQFIDQINANVRALQSFASKIQIADGILLYLVTSRLDKETQALWEEEVSSKFNQNDSTSFNLPDWEALAGFLEKRCQTISFIDSALSNHPLSSSHQQKLYSSKQKASFVASEQWNKCTLCKSGIHSPFKCLSFMKMTSQDRFALAKRNKLCLNCLGGNHMMSNCPSKHKCQVCNASHHTLLHREVPQSQSNSELTKESSTPSPDNSPSSCQATELKSDVLLATAIVNLGTRSGVKIKARVLLDSGSQVNFISSKIAQHLQVHREKSNIQINGIGTATVKSLGVCSIVIESLQNSYSSTIQAIILPHITNLQPTNTIKKDKISIPSNINLADPHFEKPGHIDCLIGASIFYELLMVGQIKLGDSLPMLQKTQLGWVVSGPVHKNILSSSHTSFHATIIEPKLDDMLERFWLIEHIYASPHTQFTSEEEECERFFAKTTTRCPITHKFIVRLPFKKDPNCLGDSYNISRNRFLGLERKLKQDVDLYSQYSKFIEEYQQLNHMARIEKSLESRNFIPHHCVTKLDSSTTKLRVVFDASCRTSSGLSLNDILRVGPTLQDDLATILIRVRAHKIVLMADIAKMYRQVLIDKQDTRWQTILWRNSGENKIDLYELITVTYGTSSAPYLAVKCLRQLAIEEAVNFPIGSTVTLRDFYVDNLFTGGSTIEDVVEVKKEVIELLKKGGFPLRKFASNNTKVLEDVAEYDKEEIVTFGKTEYIKALGLKWSPREDCFLFNYNIQDKQLKVSKRMILSQLASVFDPLGLLNPIIVTCKILMQDLWKLKLNWDESVPQEIHTRWVSFQNELASLNDIRISRYVPVINSTEIHAFSDASTRAYGACIYAVTNANGEVSSSLLCAKSRVAPTKEISLPRLELCATLLLAELLHYVLNIFSLQPKNIHCWSDSTIALTWIKGEPYRWSPFVAHRVTKIENLTKTFTWHHVPSSKNPADIVSRGANVKELIDNQLWFCGPEFIKQDKISWPIAPSACMDNIPEQRRRKIALVCTQSFESFNNHKYINNYNKFLRIMVYIRRFINKNSSKLPITSEEIEDALLFVCRLIQQIHFSAEIKSLQQHNCLDKSSKIKQLTPFLHNGVIRVGGRIENSTLSFNAKHPVLLPSTHPFVTTIIRHYHQVNLHAGAQTLLNILREKFWIINGKNAAKRVIHNCILCYRFRPQISEQIMGNLPTDRVVKSYAFEVSGVDYCGPFLVTQQIRGRPPIKVYLAIFICFVTKAVHIELVPDLTTTAFISSLKRFFARRGKCRTIYSDNATNFVGANRELQQLLAHFHTQQHITDVETACRNEGTNWKFIPPRSPHFGGLWESAVKQGKNYIRRCIGNHILTHDELHTICCQAEAVINSRPLTPLSNDPNDLTALTPGHFLIGRNLTTIAEPTLQNTNLNLLKRYHCIQSIQQQFWCRWHNEYIKQLQPRLKWNHPCSNLKVNDLVLLKDENCPPLKWPIGRIVQIIQGDDGRVRVVTVKTSDGIHKRAITKVCKLPIEPDNTIASRASDGGAEC